MQTAISHTLFVHPSSFETGLLAIHQHPLHSIHPHPQDDAHVFIPKEFWPKMPSFADDSDEADAIRRMFRVIVQVSEVGGGFCCVSGLACWESRCARLVMVRSGATSVLCTR